MLVTVLLALALSLSLAQFQPLADLGYWSLALVAVYWLGSALIGRGVSAVTLGSIGPDAGVAQRRRLLAHMLANAWLIGGSGLIVTLGLAKLIGIRWGMAYWPLLPQLLLLTPFIVALLLFWMQEYPGYIAIRSRQMLMAYGGSREAAPVWTRREFLLYNIRHHLLFILVPVSLILLGQDLLFLAAMRWVREDYQSYLVGGGSIALAMLVFIIMPAIVVRIWRTAPLRPDALRDRLELISRKLALRFRKLLIWQTGNMIVNACVMGIWAPFRYVLLSDELVRNMEPHQVEAVFAHEAGHIVHHHIFYSGLFAAASIGWTMAIVSIIMEISGWGSETGEFLTLGILIVMWGFGFGWISRRFERQSDVTAAWVMGQMAIDAPAGITASADASGRIGRDVVAPEGAAIFARSLERVAQLAGLSMTQRNWRHGSLAWRVHYIMYLGSMCGSRAQIDSLVRRIKLGLWIAFISAAAVLAVLSIYEDGVKHVIQSLR